MNHSTSDGVSGASTFGRFRLFPRRQLLLRDGVAVPLGSRALEILTVLVRRSGDLVSKNELLAAVWPDTFVEESNLKVNVCLLRRSLGDTRRLPQYIATVAGRGYRFVAPVQHEVAPPPPPLPAPPTPPPARRDAANASEMPNTTPREIADTFAALRGKPHLIMLGPANVIGFSQIRPPT